MCAIANTEEHGQSSCKANSFPAVARALNPSAPSTRPCSIPLVLWSMPLSSTAPCDPLPQNFSSELFLHATAKSQANSWLMHSPSSQTKFSGGLQELLVSGTTIACLPEEGRQELDGLPKRSADSLHTPGTAGVHQRTFWPRPCSEEWPEGPFLSTHLLPVCSLETELDHPGQCAPSSLFQLLLQ